MWPIKLKTDKSSRFKTVTGYWLLMETCTSHSVLLKQICHTTVSKQSIKISLESSQTQQTLQDVGDYIELVHKYIKQYFHD